MHHPPLCCTCLSAYKSCMSCLIVSPGTRRLLHSKTFGPSQKYLINSMPYWILALLRMIQRMIFEVSMEMPKKRLIYLFSLFNSSFDSKIAYCINSQSITSAGVRSTKRWKNLLLMFMNLLTYEEEGTDVLTINKQCWLLLMQPIWFSIGDNDKEIFA